MTLRTGAAPKIRALKERFPEMSNSAIARRTGCTPANVTTVLKNYLKDIPEHELRVFQENKADIYDIQQMRVLGSVTKAKLAKAPAVSLITAAAILEDKARLVRGQATGINVNILMDVVDAIKARGTQQPGARPVIDGE